MVKKQEMPWWVWIIIVLLVILILNQKGFINLDIPFIPGAIVSPELTPTGTCSLSLNKYFIDAGDTVRGTIYDGPLASCIVSARLNAGAWTNIGTYRLDSNGEFYYELPVNIPGTYEILAICTDTAGVSCRTNTEILTVRGGDLRCTETDGGNVITVPGITTFDGLGYMDACVATDERLVHEYWCEGDILHQDNFMCDLGSICFATRSGGYCQASVVWNVGDVVSSESGSGVMPETGGVGFEFHDLMDFEVVPGVFTGNS